MSICYGTEKKDETWLGSVPAAWQAFRIKDIAKLSPGFSDGIPNATEFCNIIPMEAVSEKGTISIDRLEEFNLISSGLTNFEVGDVIFAKITPCMENGKGAFVNKLQSRYAFGSTEFHVLRPSYKIDGRFLYYYTYNAVFRKYAATNMTGAAGQKRVSSRFLNYTRIYLPTHLQQRRIATHLDKTCSAIDKAIVAKQRQLEILDDLRKSIIYKAVTRGLDDSVALKDSGVEWLGRIPKHWKVERLKDIVNLRNIKTTTKSLLEDYLELEDIEQGTGKILKKRNTLEVESAVTLFKKGDVLFGKLRPYLEKYYFAEFDGKCTGEILAFEPKKILGCFLIFCISSPWFIQQCNMLAYGAKMPRVNWPTQLATINIPIPPKTEQLQISNYIKTKTDEVRRLQMNIKNQISTLEQYRKSLIHECVTGKRRITEEMVENPGIQNEGKAYINHAKAAS